MGDAHKQISRRPVPEAVAKLVSTKGRTDTEKTESSTRSRLRNAIPGASHQHHNHGDKTSHSHIRSAKETVQNALELRPAIKFDHLLRRDKKAAPSRRNSANDTARANEELSNLQRTTVALKQNVDSGDVTKAREENEKREQELRSALQRVEEQGMQSTQELDATYYILLEKAEALRETVRDMQKLAKESHGLQSAFQEQSTSLQADTFTAIDNYHNFDEQERSIKQLLNTLESFRARTASLNVRLDNAKHRAEICERRVLHAQAQRRQRWSITWAVLFALVVAVLAILIMQGRTDVLRVETRDRDDSSFHSPLLAKLKAKPDNAYIDDLFDGIS